MAIKGLSTLAFADYNYNGAAVTYTNGFIAGAAIEYGLEIETSDNNPLYGDDHIIENDYGIFNGGTLTVNTSDLDQYGSKRMLGLKEVKYQVGDVSVTELVTDDDARSKPKGFGTIETHQINDIDKYRAVILCKVAMGIPAEAATTKGESIEWQTKEIEGTVSRSDQNDSNYKYPWKREAWFDDRDSALEYIKTVLNVMELLEVESVAGTEEGTTVITVEPAAASGNSYVYKEQSDLPSYKQDLTSWTALEPGENIQIANGTTICVAEANQEKKAVKAGIVTISAKAGE